MYATWDRNLRNGETTGESVNLATASAETEIQDGEEAAVFESSLLDNLNG
jgi:hypothetical protein